jgi:hypothetical protein
LFAIFFFLLFKYYDANIGLIIVAWTSPPIAFSYERIR